MFSLLSGNLTPEACRPMSLTAKHPGAILETILNHLALLFLAGAGGDMTAAKQAAAHLLAAYHPDTEGELCLAAQIASFSFHALESLTQATTPDMPMNRTLRLRGGAINLSRESHKAQRRLDELQAARLDGFEQPPALPQHTPLAEQAPNAKTDKALDLIQDTRKVASVAKATGVTWTQAYQQRQRATRIADNLKKNQARHAAQQAKSEPSAAPA